MKKGTPGDCFVYKTFYFTEYLPEIACMIYILNETIWD